MQNEKLKYGGNKEKVLKRDSNKCQKCGITREQHYTKWNRDILIHHIDGNGYNKPVDLKNNNLSNLLTLCISCHSKEEMQKPDRKGWKHTEEAKLKIKKASIKMWEERRGN